ncbi:MAG: enoyl-CoA hydratase [Acidobacteria bacterium]|nr:MAG: enoyl-CoA hydratase [Acidobacteriota bacterium]REK04516.1 MAG: enoyl-CoA hydratase [Acidobacteriota bacterium]
MPDLLVDVEGGVATVTMNRPEARNALSDEMRSLLCDWMHRLELDDEVKVVVLEGAGDHFMAGGDVKGMVSAIEREPAEIEQHFNLRIHDLHPIFYAMRRMAKPIIAKVRGAAAGAGVSFALGCDLVVASEDAFFVLAYVNIGTTPDGSSTFQLPRNMTIKQAMEMTLLGDRVSARRAYEIGYVNSVVPADALDAEVAGLAHRLASGPTFVLGQAKRLLYASLGNQWETQLQAEAESFARCAARGDFREGVTAFVEKRKPRFTGG